MSEVKKGDQRLVNFVEKKPLIEEMMRMFNIDPRDMRVLTEREHEQELKNKNCKI